LRIADPGVVVSGEDVGLAATLSVATASIAFTISETAVLAGFRSWTKNRSDMAGKLVSCGYCMSHWISFALVAIYRPRLVNRWWLLDYLLTALIVAWSAAFQWAVLAWLMQRTGK
jgi:hypothetical protein